MAGVYHGNYPPVSFNPGVRTDPCGGFHVFDAAPGGRVPLSYPAEGEGAAISEQGVHDLPVDTGSGEMWNV